MNNPYFNNDGYMKPSKYYNISEEYIPECIKYIYNNYDKPSNIYELDVCKREYKIEDIKQQNLKVYDENNSTWAEPKVNINKIGIVLEENCFNTVNSRKMMLLPYGKGIIPHYSSPSANEIQRRILNCSKGFIKLN